MDASPTALRAFLKVAEELHFGRAARALYLTTPALSQQIARLEKVLDASLFVRSSRAVELTAAGRELVPLAREAVSALDRIDSWKRRRGAPSLRIAFSDYGPLELTFSIFDAVSEGMQGVELSFVYTHRDEIIEVLRAGEVDVAFLWGPFSHEGIRTRILTVQLRVLMLPESCPLAAGDELKVSDLARLPLLEPDSSDPAYLAWVLLSPRPDGSAVRRGPRVRDLQEALAFVAAGVGGYLVPQDVAAYVRHPRVTSRPVIDAPGWPFSVSAVNENSSEVVERFLKIVDGVAHPSR